MKFPKGVINETEYINKITELLKSDDCVIFLDTNILSQFYKLHSIARNEVFSWMSDRINKGKLKTPVWALNEYSNRFVRDKIKDYIPLQASMSTLEKGLSDLKTLLNMNIGDSSLTGTEYSNSADFFKDVDDIYTKFVKIKKATANTVDSNQIHKELVDKLEASVLTSNIYEYIEKASTHGRIRYENKVPPGFKDEPKADKDQNQYGDLIVWFEILDFCKQKEIKKAILLTNDAKKDWIYTPQNKIVNILGKDKTVANTKPEIRIADPRLVYEFNLYTDSNELYIINFNFLIERLAAIDNNSFKEVAKAVQVIARNIESSNKIVLQEISEKAKEQTKDNTPIQSLPSEALYDITALQDANFIPNEKDPSSEIILSLKSYTWDVQNAAVEALVDNIKNVSSKSDQNHLFVLGRNIYQAAIGSSFVAIEFLEGLKHFLNKFGVKSANHLLSGMYYEMYFDSQGMFRANHLKDEYFELLFSVQNEIKYKQSIEFINMKLQPHKQKLVVWPHNPPIIVDFNIKGKQDEDQFIIDSLYYKGHNFIENWEDPFPMKADNEVGYESLSKDDFIKRISSALTIPISQIRFDVNIKTKLLLANNKVIKSKLDQSL